MLEGSAFRTDAILLRGRLTPRSRRLHVKMQQRVRRDRRRSAASSIAQLRRDDQLPALGGGHACDALIPPADDLTRSSVNGWECPGRRNYRRHCRLKRLCSADTMCPAPPGAWFLSRTCGVRPLGIVMSGGNEQSFLLASDGDWRVVRRCSEERVSDIVIGTPGTAGWV